jgi:hypothetical protein
MYIFFFVYQYLVIILLHTQGLGTIAIKDILFKFLQPG